MDGDGDAPRLAPSSGSVVTRETLFLDWQREVEARNECGPHNVSAYDYIHARLDQLGKPLNIVNSTPQEPHQSMNSDETPPCSTHPDAPHGFDRDGSHSAGRYVCDCEGWIPPKDSPPAAAPSGPIPATKQEAGAERGGGEPQSAVEWVRERMQKNKWNENYIWEINALELARRCDESESEAALSRIEKNFLETENGLANAYIDELKRELAAAQARADEAERERDLCKLTLERMPSDTDSNSLQLPKPQSAVEWVKERLVVITTDPSYPPYLCLTDDDALDLARRCDAAEAKHAHFIYRNERYKLLEKEADQLRSQLAAAQDKGESLTTSMGFYKNELELAAKEVEILHDKLADAQAEVKDLREQKRHLQDQLGSLSRINAKERLAVADELRTSQAEAMELREALKAITRRIPIMGSAGQYREGQLYALAECSDIARAALAKHAKEEPKIPVK